MSEVTKNNVTEDQSAASNSAGTNSARESVGDLLRATRIKAGKEILTVAGSLRISMRYLEALEDGRNDDLPGATYAVGFVRSYAEYLGLDEDEIVRRFKEQTSELSEKSELTFPKPIPEGGVPG
ncbi:MAG: helix-turn-helix domain-containing protein, partial [Rhodospirillaceae bacterium]|nr:helix-turn-helix domain-containing protein [Rhodospirillaceae bacterium]